MSAPYSTRDMAEFLFKYMPPWFGSDNPVLIALLHGFGSVSNFIYYSLVFLNNQTRITDATEEFLDLYAQDYFGSFLQRCPDESDVVFRQRILNTLFAPRVTRQAMIDALTNLTGRAPIIYEPFLDCGFYDHAFLDNDAYMGENAPYQAWIIAYRAVQPETNNTIYLDESAYLDQQSYYPAPDEHVCVSDADILKTIEITKLAGTFMHVTISD